MIKDAIQPGNVALSLSSILEYLALAISTHWEVHTQCRLKSSKIPAWVDGFWQAGVLCQALRIAGLLE